MKRTVNKWLFRLCCLLTAAVASTSCSMMHDDLDDCPIGLYLAFEYDYNLQRADMFGDHVGSVTVYVYDEQGRYVTKQEESNTGSYSPLSSPLYRMHMNLQPGRYKFIVLAGQKSYGEQLSGPGANFVRTEPQPGESMEQFAVTLDHGGTGTADSPAPVLHEGQPLDTLWHGIETKAIAVYDTKPTYHTISLTRDTKKINVSLREIADPTQMDVDDYAMTITDRNARILWDNAVDETETLVYTPHATWETTDRTPATDLNGHPLGGYGKTAHADFMTSRILYHEDAADDGVLSIVHTPSGREVVRVNLPDMLSRLCNAEDYYRYSPQEFLDRGYDYSLDFYLLNGELQYVDISISVLSWSVRVNYVDL